MSVSLLPSLFHLGHCILSLHLFVSLSGEHRSLEGSLFLHYHVFSQTKSRHSHQRCFIHSVSHGQRDECWPCFLSLFCLCHFHRHARRHSIHPSSITARFCRYTGGQKESSREQRRGGMRAIKRELMLTHLTLWWLQSVYTEGGGGEGHYLEEMDYSQIRLLSCSAVCLASFSHTCAHTHTHTHTLNLY